MKLSPSKINWFTLFKLPSVYFCGVRVKSISEESCTVSVRHRWINQNPFKSLFWAVQGMAAELSTGAMVMNYIQESGKPISMLVAHNKATFSKKATGKIIFTCTDGLKIKNTIAKAVETGEGQTCWMTSVGRNKEGVIVSEFHFEWTVKLRG
ncbi:MAG: thioesterase [Alteromonas sp.]|nr:thioesterase [Alteromonas sp.]MAY23134.1 thioesterase [Flavobacteriaceae bacterium]|tara:strand:+ start:156376 stop:156831 length:456 start_codon:yes stop_codon:yes gene_type:complete